MADKDMRDVAKLRELWKQRKKLYSDAKPLEMKDDDFRTFQRAEAQLSEQIEQELWNVLYFDPETYKDINGDS